MIVVRDLRPQDVAVICDHSFLLRPECYREASVDPFAVYESDLAEFLARTERMRPLPYAVCVRAEETARVRRATPAEVRVVATVGFPLGDVVSTQLKIAEAKEALRNGAGEIDVVLCWRALQAGSLDVVEADLSAVTAVAHQGQALIKAILEVCELNEQQIRDACAICAHVGADFVKTSTGFGRGGANEAALRIMRDAFRGGIKIAGGVKADNLGALLAAALGEEVEALDPLKIRIGESSLLLPNRPT